jgi:hypothetical protein
LALAAQLGYINVNINQYRPVGGTLVRSDEKPLTIRVESQISEATRTVSFVTHWPLSPAPSCGVQLGDIAIGTADGDDAPRSIAFDDLRRLRQFDIKVVDANGQDRSSDYTLDISGDFLGATRLSSQGAFFDKVQLNHLRYKSPLAVEIGARAAYWRFSGDFTVQAAALTIIAHRFLEVPVTTLKPTDDAELSWLFEQAEALLATGEAKIAEAASPDWEVVRWTISLATVAGYIALIQDRYARAEQLFAIPVRHIDLVHLAKVSALNVVNGCFLHGMLSLVLGRADAAKASLTKGVQSLPAIVSAQNLMENVWVIGDMMNLMRAARQSFIAMVRLRLIPATSPSGPVIAGNTQIAIAELQSPLHGILLAGRAALLARAVTNAGGSI